VVLECPARVIADQSPAVAAGNRDETLAAAGRANERSQPEF
jgi:hypothetical protein